MRVNRQQVEQWGLFEVELEGPDDGNPFLDTSLSARFVCGDHIVETDGFYDGDGVYRVRVMPEVQGEWHFTTCSNVAALDGLTGGFTCVAPSADNQGRYVSTTPFTLPMLTARRIFR